MRSFFGNLVGRLNLIWAFFGIFLAFNVLNPSLSLAGEREEFMVSVVNELETSIENSRASFIDLIQAKFERLGDLVKVSRDIYLQTYLDAFDIEVARLDEITVKRMEQFTQIDDPEMTFEEQEKEGRFILNILIDETFNPEKILQSLEGKIQIIGPEAATSETDPELCGVCKKKTHLMFHCKCEGNFCLKHRDSFKHKCTYDYKKAQRELLIKQNPKVVGSKITPL
jgi:hypothetical protein